MVIAYYFSDSIFRRYVLVFANFMVRYEYFRSLILEFLKLLFHRIKRPFLSLSKIYYLLVQITLYFYFISLFILKVEENMLDFKIVFGHTVSVVIV